MTSACRPAGETSGLNVLVARQGREPADPPLMSGRAAQHVGRLDQTSWAARGQKVRSAASTSEGPYQVSSRPPTSRVGTVENASGPSSAVNT